MKGSVDGGRKDPETGFYEIRIVFPPEVLYAYLSLKKITFFYDSVS